MKIIGDVVLNDVEAVKTTYTIYNSKPKENMKTKSLSESKPQSLIIKISGMMAKRTIDIIGAIVGIILLIPLTIIIAILNIINNDTGPIFYAQKRIGKDGKEFKLYKFRTMVVDAEEELKKLLNENPKIRKEYIKNRKIKNDPRVTRIGKFLRVTSLDEFPQFINVLIGNMSLVGPRPYLPKEKNDMEDYYNVIIKHKPGLTGFWQVSGRSNTSFQNRLDMDIRYHESASILFDIKILFKTILNVIKKEGAV